MVSGNGGDTAESSDSESEKSEAAAAAALASSAAKAAKAIPPLMADAAVFNVDTLRWGSPHEAPPGIAIERLGAATCVVRERCYVFGGEGRSGGLRNDLLRLDFSEADGWAGVATRGTPPPPRRGHALCAAEDGRRLWLFGGRDEAGEALDDLYVLNLDAAAPTWQLLKKRREGAPWPAAREGALSGFVDGKHLVMAGGADGQWRLADAWIMDTETLEWECLDEGGGGGAAGHVPVAGGQNSGAGLSGMGGAAGHTNNISVTGHVGKHAHRSVGGRGNVLGHTAAEVGGVGVGASLVGAGSGGRTHAAYCGIVGRRVYTLHPVGRDEALGEVTWIELTPPDELETMRRRRGGPGGGEHTDVLALADDYAASAHTLELSWRVPARNADRIERCKLMMASTSGVVKEVCSGRMTTHTVIGLRPNTEYIFSVKAEYADGAFKWSESKAYRTVL